MRRLRLDPAPEARRPAASTALGGFSKRALAADAVTLRRRWVVSPMGKLGTPATSRVVAIAQLVAHKPRLGPRARQCCSVGSPSDCRAPEVPLHVPQRWPLRWPERGRGAGTPAAPTWLYPRSGWGASPRLGPRARQCYSWPPPTVAPLSAPSRAPEWPLRQAMGTPPAPALLYPRSGWAPSRLGPRARQCRLGPPGNCRAPEASLRGPEAPEAPLRCR